MSNLKLGQACYEVGITGEIIESNYGGHDWKDDLGLRQPTKHDLEVWLATVRNEWKGRQDEKKR